MLHTTSVFYVIVMAVILQATALYKESESEKESVIAKLGVLEEERKKLIEEITTAEQKLKEASRVCHVSN